MQMKTVYWYTKSLPFLIGVLLIACSSDKQPNRQLQAEEFQLLRELPTEVSGVDFENTIVENSRINILNYLYYYNGSGVAVGDINNDGLPDIYFAATVGENKLFLNKGNLTFQDITATAGVEGDYGITTGVSFIDINNDGYLDIYVCKSGEQSERYRRNQLFINNGQLGFTEQAAAYGLDDASFSNQAYFFDIDQDGDLDMYLLNHPVDWANINKIMTGEQNLEGFYYEYSDKLYRNVVNQLFLYFSRLTAILIRIFVFSPSVSYFTFPFLPYFFFSFSFLLPLSLFLFLTSLFTY